MGARKLLYLIEDDADIRNLVRTVLEGYGYEVQAFGSGRDARAAIRRQAPELCLVDLGLPDMDGLTLVRELWGDVRFGVIILTGRGGVSDRVLGLELGADDYIVKPFEPRELVARINSVIRRREQLAGAAMAADTQRARFGEWVFDPGNLTLVADDGHQESLTAAEAGLLLALLKSPKRVLSREQLQGADCERDDFPYDRSIDVRVSRIRKKIERDAKSPRLIKTVYGAGYLFTAEVLWLSGDA
ncbi:putative DNA-binding response regulator in two-component regulatory system with EnvZ [Magnetospirillum gryphiswaldense MSR-1 v2]|uniref:DNA-binding response regulator in two-component regulatory system with EnvZ n=1 Tax=Magnetospirillum gryphiswaldense (strain DSM 6361 / JCM 21280 / NBRC 15271 / MSR-1) TaxID=431944 RepID=V6F2T6_MAGGM|nr:response regulator transcription factor [Magnetospirillum gryphiswaldense]CDK98773.1 putative DNA-binding response regulator in two-component regulatory system with EnvZ [Magnetospirillum gryphiswaldense MSR-1 v2]